MTVYRSSYIYLIIEATTIITSITHFNGSEGQKYGKSTAFKEEREGGRSEEREKEKREILSPVRIEIFFSVIIEVLFRKLLLRNIISYMGFWYIGMIIRFTYIFIDHFCSP